MPKMTVLADDLDGKPLPDDTTPIRLSLGRKSWDLYLSDANQKKLYDALNKFTDNAEVVGTQVSIVKPKTNPEQLKEIREWARGNGWPDLKDRGRIPEKAMDAYKAAH